MTTREILLTLHIVFVAGWLGADILQFAITPRLDSDSKQSELAWARQTQWFHERYYPMVAVGVLATGIWLVIDGPWKWSSGFIWVGVGAIVAGATLGGGLLGSLSKRRTAALEAGDAGLAGELKRKAVPVNVFLAVVPVVAILAMVDKWHL